MHRRTKLFLIIAVAVILIAGIAVALFLIDTDVKRIDQTMYATLMDSSGSNIESITFSLKGTTAASGSKQTAIDLQITAPDTFRYQLCDGVQPKTNNHTSPVLYGSNYVFDADNNEDLICMYWFYEDTGYMVMHFQETGQYLLASPDRNADVLIIAEQFKELIALPLAQ